VTTLADGRGGSTPPRPLAAAKPQQWFTVFLIGSGPDFDPQCAMTTDLDEPLIIASVTADGSGQPYPAADRRLCTTGHCPQRGCAVHWPVPEPGRPAAPAGSTMR